MPADASREWNFLSEGRGATEIPRPAGKGAGLRDDVFDRKQNIVLG